MKTRWMYAVVVALTITAGCNTDPEAAKKKYVERGNVYFSKGKYKEAMIMYRNALKKDPKYGEAYYRAALATLATGDNLNTKFSAARDLYRAIEFQPDNMDAYRRLTDIYIEAYIRNPQVQYVTEMKTLQDRLAKRHANSYEHLRLSGYLALADNKLKDAINYFSQAEKIKPYQQDVILVMMNTLQRDGRADEAERLGKETLKQQPKVGTMYDALFMVYLSQRRLADAEEILKAKVQNIPDNPDNYVQLAAHYFSMRKDAEMSQTLAALTADTKRFPDGFLRVGDFKLKTRDINGALEAYKAGMERFPKDKAMYQKRIIEAYTLNGNLAEANKVFVELAREHPKEDDTLAISATLRMMSGKKEDLPGALDDLQALMTRKPGDAVIRYNLGRAYLIKGNSQQARIQFEEAIKLRPDYLQPRIALGEILVRNREFGKVIQISGEVLRLDPRNRPARLMRSRSLLGIGEFKQARAELEQLLSEDPNLTEAKLQLAVLDNVTRNPAAAEKSYKEIYERTKDSRALVGLAETYLSQNRPDDAMKLLNDELKRDPSRNDFRIIIGNIAVRAKRYDVALDEFNTVLKNDPKDADTWVRLGETQRLTGDSKAAMASFRKALDNSPNNIPALLQLGMTYDASNQFEQSRPLYQQVLRMDADNAVALNNMAFAMAETGGDLDGALNMAQRAKSRLPQDLNVLDTLGWIYMKKNLSDSAIGIFREIVRQDPSRSTYRYHLGLALAQKGNKVEAKKELDSALRSKPDKDEEAKIKELMAKLG